MKIVFLFLLIMKIAFICSHYSNFDILKVY